MLYDIFSNTVKQKNADVNTIELIMNSEDCNRFIVCDDFNKSFSRSNAQSSCLSNFMNGICS